ncbi:MAG: putative mitochondrial protein, conserved [Vezdaea aestivalis]|nr:MAG: putative mitochondrial protein, conserved [Vezdaea aestivalis]
MALPSGLIIKNTTRSRQITRYRSAFVSRPLSSKASPFAQSPAPPSLPADEQARFEALQRGSRGAFSTPAASSDPTPSTVKYDEQYSKKASPDDTINSSAKVIPKVEAKGQGNELHPNVRRGAAPEFEGNVNPNTGEVGGPKNEPLRWGHGGDWSYNGRVSDF